MTPTQRKAMQDAIDTLQNSQEYVCASSDGKVRHGWGNQLDEAEDAMNALRNALAEPAPEPVAWNGLTDVQWMNIVNLNHAWFGFSAEDVAHEVVRLTEARLKANNAAQSKPVATIYITPDGEREVDDWKVPLPVGRNELYAAPVRETPVPLLTDEEIAQAWSVGEHNASAATKRRVTNALVQAYRQKAGL
jgi:hypothetical protein